MPRNIRRILVPTGLDEVVLTLRMNGAIQPNVKPDRIGSIASIGPSVQGYAVWP